MGGPAIRDNHREANAVELGGADDQVASDTGGLCIRPKGRGGLLDNRAGFEVTTSRDMGNGNGLYWLEVAAAGAQSRLVLYSKSLMKDWSERKPSIVFECEDVDRIYQEVKGRGVGSAARQRT